VVSNKRRIIIILSSVTTGSLISLWIVKKRLGTLSPANYMSLLFNFIFAAALVVALAVLLKKMNDKEKQDRNR
jgi:flagellar biogenesis protein FliO